MPQKNTESGYRNASDERSTSARPPLASDESAAGGAVYEHRMQSETTLAPRVGRHRTWGAADEAASPEYGLRAS